MARVEKRHGLPYCAFLPIIKMPLLMLSFENPMKKIAVTCVHWELDGCSMVCFVLSSACTGGLSPGGTNHLWQWGDSWALPGAAASIRKGTVLPPCSSPQAVCLSHPGKQLCGSQQRAAVCWLGSSRFPAALHPRADHRQIFRHSCTQMGILSAFTQGYNI